MLSAVPAAVAPVSDVGVTVTVPADAIANVNVWIGAPCSVIPENVDPGSVPLVALAVEQVLIEHAVMVLGNPLPLIVMPTAVAHAVADVSVP